ncbi:MAG: hypothetical protein QN189_12645 [Armatimonadota bacterium]|nr:hypothetical protein [Armatimonadota bacterium]
MWLVIRRKVEPLIGELLRLCGLRWSIDSALKESKQGVGLVD